jgi:transposase
MLPINTIRAAIRVQFVQPDMSVRLQAKLVGASHTSIIRLGKRCEKHDVDHLLAEQLNDSQLTESLYNLPERSSQKREPNYNEAFTELSKPKKKRKTRTVMYIEYRALDPSTALSKSQYFRLINKVIKRVKVVMRQHHYAGETVYIDYAGTKVFYENKGKKVWVKIFVAVLGASKKLFVWATYGEKTEHWIDGMTRAFEYFGGCTETVSMDNARALVKEPNLIANLTDNVDALGVHYGCLMDTCRVGRPQDKSLGELGVKFTTQRILVPMLGMTFFNLNEINHHIAIGVEALNEEHFQGFDISRNDLFERNEEDALKPLPHTRYKMIVARLRQQVPLNYHIKYLKHEYSVPYLLHGEVVDIFVDQTNLRVIHDHKEVAIHVVKHEPLGGTTLPEHMSAEHLADMKSNDMDLNLSWARETGEAVVKIVTGWYAKTANPKSRAIGKRCTALKKFCDKHGAKVLCEACQYADLHGMSSPSDISLIISAHNHKEGFESLPVFNPAHQNVRGAEYFGGRHEA